MKKVLAFVMMLALAGTIQAQTSDGHTVTMGVPGINVLGLSNSGPITLSLTDNGTTGFSVANTAAGNLTYRHNRGTGTVAVTAEATTSESV